MPTLWLLAMKINHRLGPYIKKEHAASSPTCPQCGEKESRVIDTRQSHDAVRRRRICKCGHRYTTHENTISSLAWDI